MVRIFRLVIKTETGYQEALNNAATRGHVLKREQEGIDRANRLFVQELDRQAHILRTGWQFPTMSGEVDEILPYMLIHGPTAENYPEEEK